MEAWQDIPNHRLEHHGPLYDSPDRSARDIVDLDDLPILDERGLEIPVYSEYGRRIKRRAPRIRRNRRPCGILFDLSQAHAFFDADLDDMSDFESSPRPDVVINAYRQGYFKSIGHVQANTVPRITTSLIADINAGVAIDAGPEHDEDEDPYFSLPMNAITGVDCQIYNAVMHRVRGSSSTHDAQRGDVTAAFAGSYSEGANQKRTAKRLKDACENRLPHENFAMIIDHPDLDTSLRLECVHHIDLTKLRPQYRPARFAICRS